jgi:hypothetical protein
VNETIIKNEAHQIEVLCCRLEVQSQRVEELEIDLVYRRRLNDELRRENTQLRDELLAAAKTISTLLKIVRIQDAELSRFRDVARVVATHSA